MAPYLVWQLIAILFVELVLFWAGLGEEEIFKIDPELGTRHMTSKRITWRSEGFAKSYLDADGMREPGLTVTKPPGTYRIALLGDSMVESLQVPIEDTFGQILERRFKKDGLSNIQVLNFGTSGYSTAQMYLQLKKQVLKYKPDLVLMVYNSRDMFENWSPPDEVITNVRPYALHLPGGQLEINNYYVRKWMRSPRARLLNSCEWLRQNSRIWGLISQLELELSIKNPAYKTVVNIITKPKNAIKEIKKLVAEFKLQDGPAFQIQFFEGQNQAKPPSAKPATAESAVDKRLISAAPTASLKENADKLKDKDTPAKDGTATYASLMGRTMGSLLAEMKKTCNKNEARLVVAFAPVRAALCPAPGMETSFYSIDYPQEMQIVVTELKARNIPFLSIQNRATRLPPAEQRDLFYMVHMSDKGHKFVAESLYPFLSELIEKQSGTGSQ